MRLVPRAEVLWRRLVFLLNNTINNGHLPREPFLGPLTGEVVSPLASCTCVFWGTRISQSLQSFPCLTKPISPKAGWTLTEHWLFHLFFFSVMVLVISMLLFFLGHFYLFNHMNHSVMTLVSGEIMKIKEKGKKCGGWRWGLIAGVSSVSFLSLSWQSIYRLTRKNGVDLHE